MSKPNNDPIGKKLGLPAYQEDKIKSLLKMANDDSAKEDFNKARANIIELLETCNEAVQKLANMAGQSQSARDFEVLAKLIDTSMNGGKTLLDLQAKKRQIEKIDENNGNDEEDKDNLFTGTTADFQSILKNYKEGKVIEPDDDENNE